MSIPLVQLVTAHLEPFEELNRQIAQAENPVEIPSVNELIHAHQRQRIDDVALNTGCQFHGVIISDPLPMNSIAPPGDVSNLSALWNHIYQSTMGILSEAEINELVLRKLILPSDWLGYVNWNGFRESFTVAGKRALLQDTAEPAVTLRLFASQCADFTFVNMFGLNQYYDPKIEYAYEAAGIQQSVNVNGQTGPVQLGYLRSQYDWWQHWVMPGQGEMQEFRLRLRNSFTIPGTPRDPSKNVWSPTMHVMASRASNTPPELQSYYDAVALRPLSVRHLQRLFDAGLSSHADIIEAFGDEHYSEANARLMASEVAGQHRLRLLLSQEAEASKLLTAAWLAGTIGDDDWSIGYYRTTLSNTLAIAAYDATPRQSQLSVAQADGLTQGQLNLLIMERSTKQAIAVVDGVKRRLFEGHITFPQANAMLANRGLTTDFIATTVQAWAEEYNPPHRELQTGEVLEALRRGWISTPVAVLRLQNLGWTNVDIPVLLAKVGYEVSEDVAKLATEVQRSLEQQVKSAEALQKQAAEQANAAKKQMLTHGTTGELMRWAIAEVITIQQYRKAMFALGEPADLVDANTQLIQLEIAKRTKPPKPPKPGKPTKPVKPPKGPPHPPVATMLHWAKKGIITVADLRARLTQLGYDVQDISDWISAEGL